MVEGRAGAVKDVVAARDGAVEVGRAVYVDGHDDDDCVMVLLFTFHSLSTVPVEVDE